MKIFDRLDFLVFFSLLFCGLLIAFRFLFFHPADYRLLLDFPFLRSGNTLMFFVWNLFLAALPYLFIRLADLTKKRALVVLLTGLWLVFLPNAPYVISDLIHLRPRFNVPYWYDVFTFVTCAFTGLLAGGLAVVVAARRFGWFAWSGRWKWMSLLLFPLCGFGIYLGRVLRWNSWDLITRPLDLFMDIFTLLANEVAMLLVLKYCLFYGVWLLLISLLSARYAKRLKLI